MPAPEFRLQTSAEAYRRDRILVIAGIVALSLLSWAYLLFLSGSMHESGQVATMPSMVAWDGWLLVLSAVMWSIMMMAMMLPTATPMVLTFARVQHQRQPKSKAARLTWVFTGAYLVAWIVFGLLAALAQWTLHGMGLLTSAMGSATPLLAGAFLLAAGVFQWSGLKDACLSKCRSPLNFLLNEWRAGHSGAFIMGLRHGAFCVGCCWMLMLLMFVGGVMNLAWMGAIAVYVLAEKIAPRMHLFSRISGVLLAGAGILFMGLTSELGGG